MPECEFASDLKQLSEVRSFVRTACLEAWGVASEEAVDHLLLAVQEAGTNIIRHGYCDPEGRAIHLQVEPTPEDVMLVFTYPGHAFNPEQVPSPTLDGTQEGGYGVYLIEQLVDQVRYGQDCSGLCQVHLYHKATTSSQGEPKCN